jgi:hypothetical protein
VLGCAHHSRIVIVPVALEPKRVPEPTCAGPVEVADDAVAVGVTVDRAPEVDPSFLLPRLGDEILVCEEIVEDAGVQEGDLLFLELGEEILAFDDLAVHLVRGAVQARGVRGPDEGILALMLEQLPAVGDGGGGGAVDLVRLLHDLGVTAEDGEDACEGVALGKRLHVFWRPPRTCKGVIQFSRLPNTHDERVTHGDVSFLLCNMFLQTRCKVQNYSLSISYLHSCQEYEIATKVRYGTHFTLLIVYTKIGERPSMLGA